MLARGWHAVLTLVVVFGLVLQVWIAVGVAATPPGHMTGFLAGTHLAGRLVRVISFFTIESNVLVAVVSAMLAVSPRRDGTVFRVVRLDALVGIAVTGIVYATVLAKVHEPHGWRETVSNAIFHYVVPIGAVLGWLLVGPRPRVTARTIAWSLLWPVLFLGYTLARGAATHWYPYPFLDVATHGYPTVLVNSVLVTVVLGLVAAVLYAGDRKLPAAPR